jgi:hypothetical protein
MAGANEQLVSTTNEVSFYAALFQAQSYVFAVSKINYNI